MREQFVYRNDHLNREASTVLALLALCGVVLFCLFVMP